MVSLKQDLSSPKSTLDEFYSTSLRVLVQMQNDLSSKQLFDTHYLSFSEDNGAKKYVRPIDKNLFIWDVESLKSAYAVFKDIIARISARDLGFTLDDLNVIDSVLYTIQQSIGIGMELKIEANAARKLVGTRFEELMRALFTEAGFANKHHELLIPYKEGESPYSCENDLVVANGPVVKSDSNHLDPHEIILSVKTTSKDRLGKMFLDKILLEKFTGNKVKYVGIFLNDVQRNKDKGVTTTFTSGLFLVYTDFLVNLDGTYYIAPPAKVSENPYDEHIHRFSQFITKDIFDIFNS